MDQKEMQLEEHTGDEWQQHCRSEWSYRQSTMVRPVSTIKGFEITDPDSKVLVVRNGDASAERNIAGMVVRANQAKDAPPAGSQYLHERGRAGLSVALAVPGNEEEENDRLLVVAHLVQARKIENGKVSLSTAGAIVAAGFELVQTGSNLFHYSVVMGNQTNARQVRKFSSVFEVPIPNVWRPRDRRD